MVNIRTPIPVVLKKNTNLSRMLIVGLLIHRFSCYKRTWGKFLAAGKKFKNKFFFFYISQDHRIAEVGNDLWRASCPTPQLQQDFLELVSQDFIQVASGYLQGIRFHRLGNLCCSSVTLTVKNSISCCDIGCKPYFS